MRVILRVRPYNANELDFVEDNGTRIVNDTAKTRVIGNLLTCDGPSVTYTAIDQKSVSKPQVRRKFSFDDVLDIGSSQQSVYEASAKPIIDKVMKGYNATVFAYGATGCGKTYTTFGDINEPGIVIRTLVEIFDLQSSGNVAMDLYMSYTEIYNEQLRDLIPLKSANLKVDVRKSGDRLIMTNVSSHKLESIDQFFNLVKRGNKLRSVSPTVRNEVSSRSHAIMNITIKQSNGLSSCLSFVDLAGSERASRHVEGARFLEGTHINTSLLALGNCINALARRSKYVPYRQSKLTMVLKPSLEGKSITVMVACVSPSTDDSTDTLNTLTYAKSARGIRGTAKINAPTTLQSSEHELAVSNKILKFTLSLFTIFYVNNITNWADAKPIVEAKLSEASTILPQGADCQIRSKCESFVHQRESHSITHERA